MRAKSVQWFDLCFRLTFFHYFHENECFYMLCVCVYVYECVVSRASCDQNHLLLNKWMNDDVYKNDVRLFVCICDFDIFFSKCNFRKCSHGLMMWWFSYLKKESTPRIIIKVTHTRMLHYTNIDLNLWVL